MHTKEQGGNCLCIVEPSALMNCNCEPKVLYVPHTVLFFHGSLYANLVYGSRRVATYFIAHASNTFVDLI